MKTESNPDIELVGDLASKRGVDAAQVIHDTKILDELQQFHAVRECLRKNALARTPDTKLEQEMIQMEQKLAGDRIHAAIDQVQRIQALRQDKNLL